ncbi:28S ribosomal protein S9, mitochondrial [Hypsibius exemplaris]|uniref:28S ribosomal protein S9, mitochondrial n=1 Tax=Hypsibius exemplaris TaxID=2072580 RepID=A0A1W0XAK7_HYPEX|nr:28S ribosomal protein S9, mitochondrial [Hypsibius exemplaris]
MLSLRLEEQISRLISVPGARRAACQLWKTASGPRSFATETAAAGSVNDSPKAIDPKVKVNKAMRAYLERAQAHNMFMKQQTSEFEIGRRHLANMMGEDPETFTQEDIDRSIQYLLPSNLFQRSSRPIMRPPEEVFPQQKEAQFGLDGRPFHPLFYTGKPNYYQILHDIRDWTLQLNVLEDERVRKGRAPPDKKLNLSGTQWMTKDELATLLVEKMTPHMYRRFILSMERLLLHPYVYRVEEFVRKYRKALIEEVIEIQAPALKKDEAGRSYTEAYANRKTCHAWVTLKDGTGKVDINGQDILFFPRASDRLQIMFPLQLLDRMFQFDISAKVEYGGYSGKSGAIREALTKCLTAFVSKEEVEILRHAGLLTHDKRVKERKKVGFRGARAKPTWRKR